MHIDRRSIAKEPLDRAQIQIPSPSSDGRTSEDNLRDVLVGDKFGHS